MCCLKQQPHRKIWTPMIPYIQGLSSPNDVTWRDREPTLLERRRRLFNRWNVDEN
ncbi:hypothetical protein Hanom_Chr04g00373301 [Helianthus anomalus]